LPLPKLQFYTATLLGLFLALVSALLFGFCAFYFLFSPLQFIIELQFGRQLFVECQGARGMGFSRNLHAY